MEELYALPPPSYHETSGNARERRELENVGSGRRVVWRAMSKRGYYARFQRYRKQVWQSRGTTEENGRADPTHPARQRPVAGRGGPAVTGPKTRRARRA
jgi:hypothetical protein